MSRITNLCQKWVRRAHPQFEKSNRAEGALRRSVTVAEVQISSVFDISRTEPNPEVMGYTSGLACLRCWMEGVQVSNLTSEVRNLMRIA